ncbi:MAG TPA: AAA family ATPase [Candidatus Avalokitesvara rifleensis]|uniref:AAA family ATPase n=1 Tax=Candidatus Avalokitesvara rifleensis TaxID=3367620 RepID=UPI00402820CF
MRITKLTIRGFNDEQSILLDGDLVIIYGLNGSGKSSFTEALEWLFFGEISRQRLSRCRSDYQYEEYLKNLFYTGPGNPFVEVQGLLNGKSVKVRKEITAGGEKCFIDDKEVPDFGSINLDLQNYFRPMLAQTEIQALVDTEQKDRWEQLSSILGQDDLTRLRDNLISLKKKKKDENYKKQELKWQSILSDINDIQSLAPFSQPVQLLEGNSLLSEIQRITGRPSVNLKDILEEVKVRQKSLLNTELGRRVTDISYKDTSDLIKYLEELTDNLKKLEEHAKVLALEGHDHNYLEFLQTGLSFVKYPECPFCLERTLTRKRLDIINNTLEQGKGAQEAKSQFTQTKSSINLWVSTFPEKIKLYLPLQQELKIISQKFLDIDEAELAAKVQEVEKNISALIADCARELQLGVDEFFSYLEKKYFHNNRVDEGVHAKLDSIIGKITSQQEDIISKWEDLKIKIAEKLPFTGEGNQEEIKKWFTLEKVISFFIGAEVFIKQTNLLKQADSIQTKLEQYEKNEVSRLLETHASEIKNYYEKLKLVSSFSDGVIPN